MSEQQQRRVESAHVLVIGAGGLGCPAIQYLAGAGVGTLEIIDADVIEESNLHRQPLYTENDIGDRKSLVAARRAASINSSIKILPRISKFDRSSFCSLKTPDVVIDGTDNFESKYLISEFCNDRDVPWVFGSVYQHWGQLAVFNHLKDGQLRSGGLEDLYPSPPPAWLSPSCNLAGAIGMSVAVIGCLQSMEAFKIIAGLGNILTDRVMTYDALTQSFQTLGYTRQQTKRLHSSSNGSEVICEASWEEALANASRSIILDVRSETEAKRSENIRNSLNIPLVELPERIAELSNYDTAYVFCARGARSRVAVKYLNKVWRASYSIAGGYAARPT